MRVIKNPNLTHLHGLARHWLTGHWKLKNQLLRARNWACTGNSKQETGKQKLDFSLVEREVTYTERLGVETNVN